MQTTNYTVRTGETIEMEIPVLTIDIVTTPPTTTNIIVRLVNEENTLIQYSLVDMGIGWNLLTVTGNVINLSASRDDTKLWKTGYASAVITIEQKDALDVYTVYDFKIENFVAVSKSMNAQDVLIHV